MFLCLSTTRDNFWAQNIRHFNEFLFFIKIIARNCELEVIGSRIEDLALEAYFVVKKSESLRTKEAIRTQIIECLKKITQKEFHEKWEQGFVLKELTENDPCLLETIKNELTFKKPINAICYEDYCLACLDSRNNLS